MNPSTDQLNVALITGAAAGIGHATAKHLYKLGYQIIAWDRNFIDSKQIGNDPARILCQQVDISQTNVIDHALQKAVQHMGGVSILVNNAGISPKDPNQQGHGINTVTPEEWQQVIAVNLTAPLHLMQRCAPFMKKQQWGRVINIASQASRTRSRVPGVAYVCTKTALIGLSRYGAEELGPDGITVNTLTPGRIISAMTNVVPISITETFINNTPVRRLGTPDDVAHAIAFFCQHESSFLNGTILDVNGGLYMP